MTGQQLKNSILQEAIEGRLVPQDPNDEPASVLLDKIRKEKARLVKEGTLKKSDLKEREILLKEVPFTIPKGWVWTKIDNVAFVTKLAGFEYTKYIASNLVSKETGIPLFKGKNVQNGKIVYEFESYIPLSLSNELKRSQINRKCLLTPYVGTIGNIGIHDREGVFHLGSNVGKIEFYNQSSTNILEEYAKYYLMSRYGYQELTKYKKATAQESISIEAIRDVFFPLPPIKEQKRIVAKLSALFSKVEEYGKAQEALDKLNKEMPERLKKSILQEAIEGRLVPQDPNDEPASVLLDKIRKEKARLVKEGKLKKKDLEEIPISEDEIPFEIPESWCIVRLGEITYNHGQKTPDEDFSYIDIGSIDNKRQKLNVSENIIKSKDAPSRARKIVKKGDILYATVRPYLHNMCIIDKDFNKEPIASTGFSVLSCIKGIHNKFLFYYLLSPIFDAYANDGDNAKGMAYPAINDKKLYNGLVPLPPLEEQHRIVAKIEQLLNEIDKLKV